MKTDHIKLKSTLKYKYNNITIKITDVILINYILILINMFCSMSQESVNRCYATNKYIT